MDKMKVQSLPELGREIIIAEHIDKIKQIAEINIAFAATHWLSELAESEVSRSKSVHLSRRSRRSSKDSSNTMQQ